ncbi:AAA family ATPase [Moorella sp. Hama-1]|uniref:AAA family ATPase n=1 Tax=Moorella sp. Hama-1 TaxID=2138101 RepID=UPI000D6497CA|nr:AAA family ATPase [Moorella sp. Hama-1]MDN5361511.1 vesicle-fusing ATPase [Moorella sp. (in: firmicutes)]BCV21165.1 vesicle-fusing ATPase [Moorella sp. Hama-1]
MLKEIAAGTAVGVLIFLALKGVDVTPFLLLAGMGFLAYWLIEKKGLISSTLAGKSYTSTIPISFADIGGQGTAIRELKEALEFLLRSNQIQAMGIRPLKGLLLSGPPGTGKTLMARAAATYTDAVFLATSGSEFIEMYAGVGAQRVRNLFNRARELARRQQKKRAIIFIDELEVLGGKRGSHTSHLEYDQTLNQLLVEMDGLKQDQEVQILVIGATNRADLLDPALLRPGRFDRQVRVDLPDREGRLAILKLHTANKPLAPDADLEVIARETFGFSGAHLESVANEAAILALREKVPVIEQKHLMEAVDKVMLGEKLGRKPSSEELYRLAIHEAGHAVTGELLRPRSVSLVTITSRGQALGYTRQKPEHDIYLYTRDYLETQIAICLAGAVAETLVLGSRSTGSLNDFKESIRLARVIITSGLSDLGVVAEENLSQEQMHEASTTIINQEEERVTSLLQPRLAVLQELARSLVERETISGQELRLIMQDQARAS